MHKNNVAVVGAGYWGKNLARNFHEIGALHTICDSNTALAEGYAEKYPSVVFTPHFDEVLANPEVEALAIATPAASHFSVASAALKSGKHVLVEKPLALDANEGQALVELAERVGRVLMVGHILQYHGAVIKLKELIDRGELGKVNYLCSNRLSIGKIRNEENILWSFAPHDISVILMLLGEEPARVQSTGGSYLQKEVADVTLTTMDFPSGAKAHIFVSWLHPFKEQKLIVIGDRKMAVFDDVSKDKLLLYPHRINWVQRLPVASKAEAEVVEFQMTEPLRQECLHFLECIENGTRPKTDGREGLRVLKVLQASQASLDGYLGQDASQAAQGHGTTRVGAEMKGFFAHETACIDENVRIGQGTKIWHFSHILSGTSIGERCNIGQNVVVGPQVNIGKGCKIQNNVSVYQGVTLEDYVFCGPSMVFTNIFNPRAAIRKMDQVRTTRVGSHATLGANCTVVCGVNIGRYAFVGAGAVVTKDVPDHALVVGNPARRVGYVCECGEKLSDDFVCKDCGAGYERTEKDGIRRKQGQNQ
jgi:UDP-2-acetamido-3-amino-2,3-dideoxy-glucuronate N-acetyltransferase